MGVLINPAGQGNYRPRLERQAEAMATVDEVRLAELVGFSVRMQRLGDFEWARPFATVGGILAGAGVGALISLPDNPADKSVVLSWAVIAVGVVCWVASLAIRNERGDSLKAIREDLDVMLASFDPDVVGALESAYEKARARSKS